MDGVLIDFWRGEQVPAEQMRDALLGGWPSDAQELGCERELEGVEDLLAATPAPTGSSGSGSRPPT